MGPGPGRVCGYDGDDRGVGRHNNYFKALVKDLLWLEGMGAQEAFTYLYIASQGQVSLIPEAAHTYMVAH